MPPGDLYQWVTIDHRPLSAMSVYSAFPVYFALVRLYLRGPLRLGGALQYVPIPPAPESYSYAASVWYYLPHRQCFNQFLGILGLLFYAMGEMWMNKTRFETVFEGFER
ncbi:hypothetical protein DER44DRAFT_767443 [Fusarium oxysporum]|nr:hypothetical protein DER44DRAFT_767443 [Fusarium oxysporum]